MALLAMRGDASRDMKQMIMETLNQNKPTYAGITQPIFKDITVPTVTMTSMSSSMAATANKLLK